MVYILLFINNLFSINGRKAMILSSVLTKKTIKTPLAFLPFTFFLWGCAEKVTYDFPPACPKVSILPAASDYFVFENNQDSLPHLITKASIIEISGNCTDDPKNEKNKERRKRNLSYQDYIDTQLSVTLQIQRGPAAQTHSFKIPYFIATIHNGKVVDKQEMIAEVSFPNNIDQVKLESKKLMFKVPATTARTPDGYKLTVGFQLSPNQLEYNRHHFGSVQYNSY